MAIEKLRKRIAGNRIYATVAEKDRNLDNIVMADKADKVVSATNNNLAAFDASGNLKDSGVASSAVSTAVQDVKIGNSSLKDANNVATIPVLSSTTDGVVTAPTEPNRNAVSFLNGMGDWSMMDEVSEDAIHGLFLAVTIGGRDYKVVQIGNQLWMAENLDYKFEYNGGTLPVGESGAPTTPAAWYYNNNVSDYGIDGTYKCGLLYNGYAALYLEANKATLLPDGWHVPTRNEWDVLRTSIGQSTVGTKIKAKDNTVTANWPSGWNGTDDYGFNALPTGRRDHNTSFVHLGDSGGMWTSTYRSEYSDLVYASFQSDRTIVDMNTHDRENAMPIRLVKALS